MTIIYALKQIKNHWVRTLLAVLGVLIGTCAFIVLTNIGLIFKYNMEKELNELENIHIFNLLYPSSNAKFLTEADISKLKNTSTKAIIPIATKSYNYQTPNGNTINLNILGIPFNKQKPFDLSVSEGRLIIPNDERNVTLSKPLADELNANMQPVQIGIDLLLDHQVLHVVVHPSKQSEGLRTLLFGDVNHQIVMNLNSALQYIPDMAIERVIIELKDDTDTKISYFNINKKLNLYHQHSSLHSKFYRLF